MAAHKIAAAKRRRLVKDVMIQLPYFSIEVEKFPRRKIKTS